MHDETRRHFDGLDLIPPALERELLENGRRAAAAIAKDGNTADVEPVVKLFTPWTGATWLLSELDPAAPDIAFGLCDLGMGSPELGNVSLDELRSIRGPAGLTVERDIHFRATKPLSAYTAEARAAGRIKA